MPSVSSLNRRWIMSVRVTSSVTKLDRLARSVGDLLEIVARIEAKKVSLRVLAMSGAESFDTSTATALHMQMYGRQRKAIAKARGQMLSITRLKSKISRHRKWPSGWTTGFAI